VNTRVLWSGHTARQGEAAISALPARSEVPVPRAVLLAGRLGPFRGLEELVGVEWVRLKLDLEAFDDVRFESYLRRCQQAGIEFTTMAVVGDTAEHRRALYELNKTCSADIPGRGAFYTFDEYLAQRIDTSTYDPRGVVLALDGGSWVGMAATTIRPEGHAFSEMTGVLAGYRGRGISLAMKLLAIGYARSSGVRWLRTLHHPGNASAIGMNRRLGFVDDEQPTSVA
jgi:GNAT superfamily N-acetyltransferase